MSLFLEPITEETQSDLHSAVSGSVSGGGSAGGAAGRNSSRGGSSGRGSSTAETVRAGSASTAARGSALRPPSRGVGIAADGAGSGGLPLPLSGDDGDDEIRNPSLKRWWHVMGISSSHNHHHHHHQHGSRGDRHHRDGGSGGRGGGGSRGSSGSANSERGSVSTSTSDTNSSTLAVDMGDDGRDSGAHRGLITTNLLPPMMQPQEGLQLVNSMEGEYDDNEDEVAEEEEDMLSSSNRTRSFGSDGGGVELGLAGAGAGVADVAAAAADVGGRGPDYAAGGDSAGARKVSFANTVQVASLPVTPVDDAVDVDGDADNNRKRRKKKQHHQHSASNADGTIPAASAAAGAAGAGTGANHGREDKMTDKCLRSKVLIFSALLASILAIAIGVAVHFAGNSGDGNSSGGVGGAEEGVSPADISTEAPTMELFDDGIDNGRDDPDKGSGGGGGGYPPDSGGGGGGGGGTSRPSSRPVASGPTSAPTADPYRQDYLDAAYALLTSISAPPPTTTSNTDADGIEEADGGGGGGDDTSIAPDSNTIPTEPNPVDVVGTPQNLAYRWITMWDQANLQLYVGQPSRQEGDRGSSSSRREVVTERRYSQRYALGVMYYSFGGTSVDNDDGGGRLLRIRRSHDHALERNAEQSGSTLLEVPSRPMKKAPKARDMLTTQHSYVPKRRQGLRVLQGANGDAETIEPTLQPTTEPTVEVTLEPTPGGVSLEPTPASPLRASAMDPFNNYVTSSSSSPDDEPFLSSRHECRWHGVSCESRLIIDPDGKVTGMSEEVVVAVDLSGLGLTGTIPHEIGSGIVTLEDLSLYDNDIFGPIPPSLTGLTSLYFFDAGKNWLTGSVPVFGESLTYLYMNANRLSGRPSRGRNGINYDLKHLWLHQNSLSGTLSDRISNFGNLEQLILYENNFSGSIPTTISSLAKLSYLDLSSNSFTGTLPDSLYEITTLVNLYLSNNLFSGPIVAPIRKLVNLEFLWADSNFFTGSIRPAIGDLLALKSILLQDNQFVGEMPDAVCRLFPGAASDGAQGQLIRLEADCSGDLPKVNCTCCTECW